MLIRGVRFVGLGSVGFFALLSLVGCSSGASTVRAVSADGSVEAQTDAHDAGSAAASSASDADADARTKDAGPAKQDAATPGSSDVASCLAVGSACISAYDAEPCCTDTCTNGICGGIKCTPEGKQLLPDSGGFCCGDAATTDAGYCGTNACVPDGTPCGPDGGVVCCNDNCNGTICGS